jgi:hypothetical protein
MICVHPIEVEQLLPFFQDATAQQFGDLHGVEGRAFAQVVGHAPQV